MKNVHEPVADGITQRFGPNISDSISFKLQLHSISYRFEFGIYRARKSQHNKPNLALSLQVVGQTTKVNVEEGDTHKFLAARALSDEHPIQNTAVELNTVARTIRFFVNGEQMHDGDVAIPWTEDVLREMFFFVRLFERGDCVRIVDWISLPYWPISHQLFYRFSSVFLYFFFNSTLNFQFNISIVLISQSFSISRLEFAIFLILFLIHH